MSRVGRLAGALLLEARGQHFLIGNLKRPCDFAAAGFTPPGAIDALARSFIPLERAGAIAVAGPWLELGDELPADALAAELAAKLLIARNGSVSDRLWRLLLSEDPEAEPPPPEAVIDARWLAGMPRHVFQIVREAVLKCT